MRPVSEKPVLIVGGGIIGLSIGWELTRAGREVVLFDREQAGRGAAWQSAGMLAADAEMGFEEIYVYRLSSESLRRWPAFADRLEEESGQTVDYRTEGTLIVADDRDSAARLRRHYQFQKEQGLSVEWLTGAEAMEIEPFVAPRLSAAVFSRSDHQVDNRRVMEALRTAFLKRGGTLREHTSVRAVEPDERNPAILTETGERIEGSCVILATGAWSGSIEGLAPETRPPIRPVKGQMLQLFAETPFQLSHVVRGPRAYVVPKKDGRLLIGSTMEEMGFDTRVTAGGLYKILEGAWEIVPGIYDLPVTDTWAGLRPGSRDNAPLLGYSDAPGIVMATGHYRHGVLLTAITAEEIARLVTGRETSPLIAPFSPRRFSSVYA